MAKVPENADPVSSTALAIRPAAELDLWDDVRLQKLWLSVERRAWRSLAVIGASASVETIQIAELLAQLAWRYRGQPSGVCDLRDLSMRLIEYELREINAQVDAGTRLVISLRSIFENPTAGPVAKQADAVLLCISLGKTKLKEAEETIATIGRDRVLGTIVLNRRPRNRKSSNGR